MVPSHAHVQPGKACVHRVSDKQGIRLAVAIDPSQHTSHVPLLIGPSPRTKRIMAAKIPDLHSTSSTVVPPSHVHLEECGGALFIPVAPRHASICWVNSTGENLFPNVGMVIATFLEVSYWRFNVGAASLVLSLLD
uniref:Uncharacterized protein n=1 Tax=Oryza meridionalis TaxID=40149 RepID=A0A0E0F6M8_9ORYZ